MNTTKNSATLKAQITPNDDDMQAEVFDERTGIVVCAVYKASEISPATIVEALNSHAALTARITELEGALRECHNQLATLLSEVRQDSGRRIYLSNERTNLVSAALVISERLLAGGGK